MKALFFIIAIILFSSLSVYGSKNLRVKAKKDGPGPRDFVDEFGIPNDLFGWNAEAFFPYQGDGSIPATAIM